MECSQARVLSSYDLGKLRAARRTEHGFVDQNWIVDTDKGRFFLKCRHPRRRQSQDLIQAQHDLIRWLHQAGFPAPVLIPNIAGETWLVLDDELYEIEEYIEGNPYDHDRPAHLEAAAHTLGTFHVTVDGFESTALRQGEDLYSPDKAVAILDTVKLAWQIDGDPGASRVVRQLEDLMLNLAECFTTHGELHRLVIHGDYHAGNLLFDGDRIVGVVDYDKANWQLRVAEVAEALIFFASPRTDRLRYLVYSGFLQPELISRFLHHYASVAPLDAGEVRALPHYISCIWISMSLRRLLEKNPRRPEQVRLALEQVLALGTWASTNAERMRATAQAAMDAAAAVAGKDVS